MGGAYRAEYLAVLKCSDELVDGIAGLRDLSGIIDSLIIHSLLPRHVWEEVLVKTDREETARKKAQKIVSAVLNKIKFRPEFYFKPFQNVLKSFNLFDVCDRLDQMRGEY